MYKRRPALGCLFVCVKTRIRSYIYKEVNIPYTSRDEEVAGNYIISGNV